MRRVITSLLLGATVVVGAATQAQAATILFTNRIAWETAVGTFTTETFNSIVSDTTFTNSSLPFSALDLISSGALSGQALVDVQTYEFNPGSGNIDGTARANVGGLFPGGFVRISFHNPVSAAGFDTVNYDVDNESLEAFVGGNLIGAFPLARGLTGFIGVIDTSGSFTSVDLRARVGAGDTFNAFDNVSFAAATVPEPATLTFLATGMAGMAMRARRRRRESR